MIFRTLQTAIQHVQQLGSFQMYFLRPQLAGVTTSPIIPYVITNSTPFQPQLREEEADSPALWDHLWFAVPKQKVTRHKKRLKTTVQKRIKLRKDIIVDPRTGEVSLKHKMPFNWKDYLPSQVF